MKMDVYSAVNGVEALQLLEECAANEWLPALLVMDVHLDDIARLGNAVTNARNSHAGQRACDCAGW